ncbi:O-antigen polymerase, partial [Psychrobacter faecalis]|uniref:O-antigen polymerase n=1 Tax=Psychrobacter faecalis TaxID=180588 RepID=UPI0019197FC5
MIKNLFYISSLVLLIFLKPEKFEVFSRISVFNFSVIYFLLILYHFLTTRVSDNNWMRFDVFFILGFTIVHLQIPFLASLGIEPTRDFHIWINKDVVNYATWMSVVSMNIWLVGYSLIKLRYKPSSRFIISNKKKRMLDIITTLSLIGLLYSAGSILLKGLYDLESWGAIATYMLALLNALLILRIVYFFSQIPYDSSYFKIINQLKYNKLFITNLLLFITLFFLAGDRGVVLGLLLVIATSYSLFVKKLALRHIATSIIVGAFIFTIIGLGRVGDEDSLDDRNMFQRGLDTLETSNRRDNITDELASSVRIQYRALDVFPEKEDYLKGKTHISTLAGIIPFGPSFIIDLLQLDSSYHSSASYFTYLGQGRYASYGEGSEILGDLYINYGLYITFLVMFIFGLYSKKCFKEAKNFNIFYVLLYCILVMLAFNINRGTI